MYPEIILALFCGGNGYINKKDEENVFQYQAVKIIAFELLKMPHIQVSKHQGNQRKVDHLLNMI